MTAATSIERARSNRPRGRRLTPGTAARSAAALAAVAMIAALLIIATESFDEQTSPTADASPPPAGQFAHGAAGTGRNGFGGEIAASPTSRSWPGTGLDRNGGPFAFVGAQYGSLWGIPPTANNSLGVGYCVMEDVDGTGTVAKRSDPAAWDTDEMAIAAALMSTFGGDRVVPYGIDENGRYDVATGEWTRPSLLGGGEYTRRRQIGVNFGVRMFVEDISPSGIAGGRKLARDTSVVRGSGGEFAALRAGYDIAGHMSAMAERQHAVGGITLSMHWGTPDGSPPTTAGTYALEVHVVDGRGKPVGYVPVLQLSEIGIETNRSVGAVARVDGRGDTAGDRARRNAAAAAGWPVWGMNLDLDTDARFTVGVDGRTADVAGRDGVARFLVDIDGPEWELALHAQAPTANVDLYAGTGVQGQITWSGRPQSASVHHTEVADDVYLAVAKSSTDPALSVVGTRFGLFDGSGDRIGRADVDADGRAVFAPFSPLEFEGPYHLRELMSAPGLTPLDAPIPVPAPLSSDPTRPTLVEVSNSPVIGTFVIRKVLDDADVQASRDMSGFVFGIDRIATGALIATVTTGPDGRTPVVSGVLGDYRIREVGRPEWAEGLEDGGPITVRFDPVTGDAAFDYTNLVPTATIDTHATDRADGDHWLSVSGTATSGSATNERDGGDVPGAAADDGAGGDDGDDDGGDDGGGADDASMAVVDHVFYCGLVPGTEYQAKAELHIVLDGSATPAAPLPSGSRTSSAADGTGTIPSGSVGSISFTPDQPCGDYDVEIDVPDSSPVIGNVGVVFQTLTLASTGVTVATHTDAADLDQRVYFPAVTTTLREAAAAGDDLTADESDMRTGHAAIAPETAGAGTDDVASVDGIHGFTGTRGSADATVVETGDAIAPAVVHAASDRVAAPGTPLVDVVDLAGLAVGGTHRAEMTLHQRRADGTCFPVGIEATTTFTAADPRTTVDVAGFSAPGPGVYVAFERITALDEHDHDDDHHDDDQYDDTGIVIAVHEDCDDVRQTIWVPGLTTVVADHSVEGAGTMRDTIIVSGLADGLPDGATAEVVGSLHHHPDERRDRWECTDENQIGGFAIAIDHDGVMRSPGEAHDVGWHSYDARLVLTFADGSAWTSDPHGCRVEAESFVAIALPPPTTTPPPAVTTIHVESKPPVPPSTSVAPTTTTTPPGTLARTGASSPWRTIVMAATLILLGLALVLTIRRPSLPAP